MSRMGQVGSVGLGRREARYWHRRVYSGMVSRFIIKSNLTSTNRLRLVATHATATSRHRGSRGV